MCGLVSSFQVLDVAIYTGNAFLGMGCVGEFHTGFFMASDTQL
jgi:hypothetical protein